MFSKRPGLFARVFSLFVLVCILPALLLVWASNRQIERDIHNQNANERRVLSFVNSAPRAVRPAANSVVKLPDDFWPIPARIKSLPAPSGVPADAFYRERVQRQLDRFVCGTELFRLN